LEEEDDSLKSTAKKPSSRNKKSTQKVEKCIEPPSMSSNKSPQSTPQPIENNIKSSKIKSLHSTTADIEKTSSIQRPRPSDTNVSPSNNEPVAINSQQHTTPFPSDLFERQNESISLPRSLLAANSTRLSSQKRVCEEQPSTEQPNNHQFVVVSSDEENEIEEVNKPIERREIKPLKRRVPCEKCECKRIKINISQQNSTLNIEINLNIQQDELQSDIEPEKVKSLGNLSAEKSN
jgi:hypothetical protein